MATEYGSRLKAARGYAGLTQVALSKKTGIPQSTISTAEREGNGSGETPVYAQACGVDALWLATGNGEMARQNSESLQNFKQKQPVAITGKAQAAINNIATLGECMAFLADYLSSLDVSDRRKAMREIADLVEEPETHQKITASIEARVSTAFAQRGKKAA